MAQIRVDVQKLRRIELDFLKTEAMLQVKELEIRTIRYTLRYKIAAHEMLSKRMTETADQLAKERRSLKSLREGIEQIVQQYSRTEKSNLQDLAKVIAQIAGSAGWRQDGRSGEELLNTPASEMDGYISSFEKEHPEDAERLNSYLAGGQNNKLTQDDIRKIKYLVYTAEEPYRSAYLRNLDKFSIGNADLTDRGAYYSNGKVNYVYSNDKYDSFGNDPRGAFTVFFHESGHAMDDVANVSNKNGYDTDNFTAYSEVIGKEVSVREAIEYDVFYNANNPHSVTSIAAAVCATGKSSAGASGSVENVIQAFKNGSSKGLSNDDLKLYNSVRKQFESSVGSNKAQYEAVTDVYGGMTGNVLRTSNGYGHKTSYWNDPTMAGKELWAEYFSYNMSGSKENLEHLREYFPEAANVLEKYAYSM